MAELPSDPGSPLPLPPLRILLISDGIPGHLNQARGLVSWIGRRRDTQVVEVQCALRRRGLVQLAAPWAMRLGRAGMAWITRQYRGAPDIANTDLIISAGGRTSFLNTALAGLSGKPNIFIGSLRHLNPKSFSARLALEQDPATNDAIITQLAPTTATTILRSQNRAELRERLKLAPDETAIAVLIGGDGAGFKYTSHDWQKVASLIEHVAVSCSGRLLLTTSRRTGRDAEAILKARLGSERLASAVWWSKNPDPVTNVYLAAADRVVVTADSMSMTTEAISSGKHVAAIIPTRHAMDDRYAKALGRLVDRGYLALTSVDDESISWPSTVANIDAIAEEVLDKLDAAMNLFPAAKGRVG